MTRTRFLALVASLPVARSAVRALAGQTVPAESAPLRSGSLLVTLAGRVNRQEDVLLLVEPDLSSSRQLVSGKGLAYVLAPDKSALYAAYNGTLNDQPLLSLGITQLTLPPWGHVIYYPRSFRGLGWSLAISPDGRRLYSFIHWLHAATMTPPPGVVVYDTDASYPETFAYTFDTTTGNFLPQRASDLQTGDFDGRLFVSRKSGGFDQYLPAAQALRRYHLSAQGSVASTEDIPNPAAPSDAASSEKPAAFHRCSAGAGSYFIHTDGRVVIAAESYKAARIDPAPKGREMQAPTVSGDGKLLFVPTGPAPHIDRIAVYETAGFTRLRELQSQRLLSSITASLDGSRLYATLEDPSISILNAASLWEEKVVHYPNPAIRAISVVP